MYTLNKPNGFSLRVSLCVQKINLLMYSTTLIIHSMQSDGGEALAALHLLAL